jgi:hypothetical protein
MSRNAWAVEKHGRLLMVCMSKTAAWDAAASLLKPLPAGAPTRHDVMAQGFAVVAVYVERSPDPARHWQASRA